MKPRAVETTVNELDLPIETHWTIEPLLRFACLKFRDLVPKRARKQGQSIFLSKRIK